MAAKQKKLPARLARTLTTTRKPGGAPACTVLDEKLYHIDLLGKRIAGYIEFMCKINEQSGLSAEMKTRAAIAFCEKLTLVEQQLGRLHDEFRLE